MAAATFARHLLVAGLDSDAGLELDADSTGCGGAQSQHGERRDNRGERERGGSATLDRGSFAATSFDFNPMERAYRPKMLRVLPATKGKKGEGGGADQPW